VQKGPVAGNYTMFDSRPGSRYHEGHIPGAKSLPFAEMEKAEKEGRLPELLPKEKDKLLVFYCGGVT
jgi:rhodanese-related sulfurtransferase